MEKAKPKLNAKRDKWTFFVVVVVNLRQSTTEEDSNGCNFCV